MNVAVCPGDASKNRPPRRRYVSARAPSHCARDIGLHVLPLRVGDVRGLGHRQTQAGRVAGGVAGSWGTVTVQNGKITLNDFVSEGELEGISSPVTELSADELALYGDKLGRKPQDVNFTPDFQRTGTIAKAMWEQRFGQRIDGVPSIDPVLLQRVLSVVGSVQVNYKSYSPVLDGQSTSRVLLNEVYAALPDPEDQDEFFSLATTAAFNRMLHVQGGQSMQLIRQLAAAVQQGHVYVWSAHAEEQSAGTVVSGSLFTAKSPKCLGGKTPKQVIGVYSNDAMGSKMDWYLERKVTDTIVKIYPNGRERHEITISLRNMLNQAECGQGARIRGRRVGKRCAEGRYPVHQLSVRAYRWFRAGICCRPRRGAAEAITVFMTV